MRIHLLQYIDRWCRPQLACEFYETPLPMGTRTPAPFKYNTSTLTYVPGTCERRTTHDTKQSPQQNRLEVFRQYIYIKVVLCRICVFRVHGYGNLTDLTEVPGTVHECCTRTHTGTRVFLQGHTRTPGIVPPAYRAYKS